MTLYIFNRHIFNKNFGMTLEKFLTLLKNLYDTFENFLE